jgi:hypothetical protein
MEKQREVNVGYLFCDECGMDTIHTQTVVPYGVRCSMCKTCFTLDEVSGIRVKDEVYDYDVGEKNWDK